ncbi:MAG TPA: hypothetical protein VHN79_14425, partial [Lacunisphaera sp.]|nr:hypothetical protein [Lacunisphaera sp.]
NTGSLDKHINKRATLSYRLDLDQHRILPNFRLGWGDYRFGGLCQKSNYSQKLIATRLVNATPIPNNPAANPLNNNANRVSRRYYLQPGDTAFQLRGPLTYSFPAVLGNTSANTGPVTVEERMSDEAPRNERRDTTSLVAVVQGAWWRSKDDSFHHLTGLYGWRQDERRAVAQSFARNAAGEYALPVNPSRAYHLIEETGTWGAPSEITARTKSYNATFRPISPLRIFYNYSDIFRDPAANFNDVRGNPLRAAFGETEDYGIKVDLFNERLFLSVTKFDTAVVDTSTDNTGTLREPLNQLLNAIQQNGNPSAADAAVVATQLDNLVRPFTYRDDTTTGYEYALTARILPNWNVRATFGIQNTIVSAAFDEWVPYFEEFHPFWEKYATVPLVTQSSGYTTVANAIARADQRLVDQRAIIGQRPTDQRSRNSSLNTTYSFDEGVLKGLRVGGGYRWRSSNALGYARDSAGNLDRNKPFIGPEEFSVDFNLGYSRKIWRGKFTWDIQLNVYNLLDDQDIKPRQAVDDGKGNPIVVRTYLIEPRTFQLTNTLRF